MLLNIYIQYELYSNLIRENILQIGYIKSVVEEFIYSSLIIMSNEIQNRENTFWNVSELVARKDYKNSHTILMMKNLRRCDPEHREGNRVITLIWVFCEIHCEGNHNNGPDRPWGLPSLLYNGYRVSFSGVKRPGRGVDHPPPPSAEVKERVELYFYSTPGT
jgi:hypothetical protein